MCRIRARARASQQNATPAETFVVPVVRALLQDRPPRVVRVGAGSTRLMVLRRLLPASVPFRFFAAAAAFHLLGWLALVAGAEQVASFRGGLGWPLAALHAVTLGVLVMTAIGASVQLLPVATRQPVLSHRLPAGLWWLYSAAVAVLVAAMAAGQPMPLAVGAAGCGLALIGWAVLLARNLLLGDKKYGYKFS